MIAAGKCCTSSCARSARHGTRLPRWAGRSQVDCSSGSTSSAAGSTHGSSKPVVYAICFGTRRVPWKCWMRTSPCNGNSARRWQTRPDPKSRRRRPRRCGAPASRETSVLRNLFFAPAPSALMELGRSPGCAAWNRTRSSSCRDGAFNDGNRRCSVTACELAGQI